MSEQLKLKRLSMRSADRDVSNWSSADVVQPLWNNLTISFQVKAKYP